MAELVSKPARAAIDARIGRMLKENFTDGKWPLTEGLLAITSNTSTGITADLYVDKPGAFSIVNLAGYPNLVDKSTPDYAAELGRVRTTPGVSIWSEGGKLHVGTAGASSDVSARGSADRLNMLEAVQYWLSKVKDGTVKGGSNAFKGFSGWSNVREPWQDSSGDGKISVIAAAWMGIYRHSNGTIKGAPFTATTLQEIYDLAEPGSTVVFVEGGYNSSAHPVNYYVDKSVRDEVGLLPLVRTASGAVVYTGFIYPSAFGDSPVMKMPQPSFGTIPSYDEVSQAFKNTPISKLAWADLNRASFAHNTSAWAEIAGLWPATVPSGVTYVTGSHAEQLSPVRAFPQIESECGLRGLTLVCSIADAKYYTFVSSQGINVKVLVLDKCDQYTSVPLEWMQEYVGRRVKKGELPVAKKTEIDAYVLSHAGAAIQMVSYSTPVMLERDLVLNTDVHRRYKKAREKNCKVDDFTSRHFTETMTYGELNTKINGSLSTREFYSLAMSGDFTDYTPMSGRIDKGTITIIKVSGAISTVTVAGDISGSFQSTNPVVGEAFVAGYVLSGGTVAELLDWLGADAGNLQALRDEAAIEISEVEGAFYKVPKAGDKIAFGEAAVVQGGYPDYKRLTLINPERARSLAMTSKGAILVGPTLSKLVFESRELK